MSAEILSIPGPDGDSRDPDAAVCDVCGDELTDDWCPTCEVSEPEDWERGDE